MSYRRKVQNEDEGFVFRTVSLGIGLFILFSSTASIGVAYFSPYKKFNLRQDTRFEKSFKDKETPQTLEPGKVIEKTLTGGQTNNYQIALSSDQYLHVTIVQKGVDVIASLFGPSGKRIIEMDSPNGTEGIESISVVANEPGNYLLEVRSVDKDAPAGRYEIKIDELRSATSRDRLYIEGQKIFAEGLRLQAEGTVESFQQAISKYQEVIQIWRNAGKADKEADTLFYIGHIYFMLGEYHRSIQYMEQSLSLKHSLRDSSSEALILNYLGATYNSLGENEKALDYFNRALTLSLNLKNRTGQAQVLNNLARVYSELGNNQKAIELYNQALQLFRTINDRQGEGLTLNSMGVVYALLGDSQKALYYYTQSLPISRSLGDRYGEANILTNLGNLYIELGKYTTALDYYNQALPLIQLVGDRTGESIALAGIGRVYASLGQLLKALESYERAIVLSRAIGNRRLEAQVLIEIGKVYRLQGTSQKALDCLKQSLALIRSVGDRHTEGLALYEMARAERDIGFLKEAKEHIEAALQITDSLRSDVPGQELRSTYFASVQRYYEFYIGLLVQLHNQNPSGGYAATALEITERARARSLLDLLAEARIDIRQGVDPELINRERTIQQRLNIKANKLTLLQINKDDKQEQAAAAKEFEDLLSEYQQIQAQIKQSSPRYAALIHPQPLSIKEIQEQVVDDETLLLEYALGDERSFLWAVTPHSVTIYELPKRSEIEALALNVYNLMTARRGYTNGDMRGDQRVNLDSEYVAAALRLSDVLLKPVLNQLGTKRLLIVAQGALQFVPFGALPIPRKTEAVENYSPLILEHEIINVPSASTIAVLRRETSGREVASKAVAVLADPVFSIQDARLSESASRLKTSSSSRDSTTSEGLSSNRSLPRLLTSRWEALQITSMVPSGQAMQALDFSANRDLMMSGKLSQYRIVHFATHGFINDSQPELSGIVLSLFDQQGHQQNGFIRLNEILNMKLPVELVVLSGCGTGLGKDIKGEGLVGLTRGFMYVGAPRVLVTLWSVDDRATAEFMVRFYRRVLKEGLSPAAALRAAQIEMLKDGRWKHPYYWASFILQGEWR